jgi:SAM-dependent methyltransferase
MPIGFELEPIEDSLGTGPPTLCPPALAEILRDGLDLTCQEGEHMTQTYGQMHSAVYDQLYPNPHPAAVGTLAALANGGRVLELGVGTGRIAIPLAQAGVDVTGVDLSPEMLAILRDKDPQSRVKTDVQNMTDLHVDGAFDLVYVVGSSFYHLLTQDEQISCLRSVAGVLRPGGLFLCHGYLPDPARWVRGLVPRSEGSTEPTHVMLDASWQDPITQRVTGRLIYLHDGVFDVLPIEHRYVWPAEMDLMAASVGLGLVERWDSWEKTSARPGSSDVFHLYRLQTA